MSMLPDLKLSYERVRGELPAPALVRIHFRDGRTIDLDGIRVMPHGASTKVFAICAESAALPTFIVSDDDVDWIEIDRVGEPQQFGFGPRQSPPDEGGYP